LAIQLELAPKRRWFHINLSSLLGLMLVIVLLAVIAKQQVDLRQLGREMDEANKWQQIRDDMIRSAPH